MSQRPSNRQRTNTTSVRQVHPLNQTRFPGEKLKVASRNSTTGSTPCRSRNRGEVAMKQSSLISRTQAREETENSLFQPSIFFSSSRPEQPSGIGRMLASGGQVSRRHTQASIERLYLPPKLQALALLQDVSITTQPASFNPNYSMLGASSNCYKSEIPPLNFSDIKPLTAGNYMNTPKPLVMPLKSEILIQTKGQRYQPHIHGAHTARKSQTLILGTPSCTRTQSPSLNATITGRAGTSRKRSRFNGLSTVTNTLPSKLQSRFNHTGAKLPGLDKRCTSPATSRNKFNMSRTVKKQSMVGDHNSPSALTQTIEPMSKQKLSDSLSKMTLTVPKGPFFGQSVERQHSSTREDHVQIKDIIMEQSKRYRSERRKVFDIEQSKQDESQQKSQLNKQKIGQGDEDSKPYTCMPGRATMRQTVQENLQEKKRRILREMAGEQSDMEARLQVARNKIKTRVDNHLAIKVKRYARYFKPEKIFQPFWCFSQSDIDTINRYAEQLWKTKCTSMQMKDKIKSILDRNMAFKANERLQQKYKIGQGKKADRKKAYLSIFEVEDGKSTQNKTILNKSSEVDWRFQSNDFIKKSHLPRAHTGLPHHSYMIECKNALTGSLPILDKIHNKTLCLQNYRVGDGHCLGLAEACRYLDHGVVNRFLLQNNGITGDQLATILDGTVHLKDLKSLIYKQNHINQAAVDKIAPLLQRNAPFHLEELALIDCKLGGTVLESMLELLQEAKQLKKFTLIKPAHNDRSFDRLVELVQNSQNLIDLDLSWQGVRPQTMIKLLRALGEDRFLHSLSIGYNRLLEESSDAFSTEHGFGCSQRLGAFNEDALSCLKQLIKFNINLVHLDIQQTGLNSTAMLKVAAALRSSWSLQCVHLCGNPVILQQIEPELRQALGASPEATPTRVIPMYRRDVNKQAGNGINFLAAIAKQITQTWSEQAANLGDSFTLTDQAKQTVLDLIIPIGRSFEHIGAKQCFMEMRSRRKTINRQNTLHNSKDYQQEDQKVDWSEIRSGLRRQSIQQQIRMSELSQVVVSVEFNKLIVQRQIGLGSAVPGADQWRVCTERRDECWHCGQYVLTVFFWTPRVGQLGASTDEDMVNFYKSQIKKETSQSESQAKFSKPVLRAPFTNWQAVEMCDVVKFCEQNDTCEPNFIDELSRAGSVRFACAGNDPKPLSEAEKQKLDEVRHQYYEENWDKVLLAILGCERPQVACKDKITLEQLKKDQQNGEPIYFSAAWVKPGRNVYTIQPPENDDLQVYQILSDFRTEQVPLYHKDKHVERAGQLAEVRKAEPVFAKYVDDTFDIQQQIFSADYHRNQLDTLVNERSEASAIQNLIQVEMQMFKSIYCELQSRSNIDTYPFIDFDSAMDCLMSECLKVSDASLKADLRAIAERICEFSKGNRDHRVSNASEYVLNRGLLLEIHLRFAFFLYESEQPGMGMQQQNNRGENQVVVNSNLTQTQALFLYIETKLKPYADAMNMSTHLFREAQLWTSENELLFTICELPLEILYKRYAAMHPQYDSPGMMSMKACQALFSKQTLPSLKLTSTQIKKAFILAQQTVVDETDVRHTRTYMSVSYTEFLEVVGRVAWFVYEDTDKKEAPLNEKITTVLRQMLDLLGDNETSFRVNRFEFVAIEVSMTSEPQLAEIATLSASLN